MFGPAAPAVAERVLRGQNSMGSVEFGPEALAVAERVLLFGRGDVVTLRHGGTDYFWQAHEVDLLHPDGCVVLRRIRGALYCGDLDQAEDVGPRELVAAISSARVGGPCAHGDRDLAARARLHHENPARPRAIWLDSPMPSGQRYRRCSCDRPFLPSPGVWGDSKRARWPALRLLAHRWPECSRGRAFGRGILAWILAAGCWRGRDAPRLLVASGAWPLKRRPKGRPGR